MASVRTGLGSGLAIGTAPFALGVLSDAVGTATAVLIVPLMLAAAAVALFVSRSLEPA